MVGPKALKNVTWRFPKDNLNRSNYVNRINSKSFFRYYNYNVSFVNIALLLFAFALACPDTVISARVAHTLFIYV